MIALVAADFSIMDYGTISMPRICACWLLALAFLVFDDTMKRAEVVKTGVAFVKANAPKAFAKVVSLKQA